MILYGQGPYEHQGTNKIVFSIGNTKKDKSTTKMSASDIKSCTLKLNGVFARLQAGTYSSDKAVHDALSISIEIDGYADTLEQTATKLRKQTATFAQENYKLSQELVKMQKKNETAQKELQSLRLEVSQYSDLFSEDEKELPGPASQEIKKSDEKEKVEGPKEKEKENKKDCDSEAATKRFKLDPKLTE